VRQVRAADAAAVVFNLNQDGFPGYGPGAYLDQSPGRAGLDGVHEHVEKDLVNLARMAQHGGQRVVGRLQVQPPLRELGASGEARRFLSVARNGPWQLLVRQVAN